MYTQFRTIGIRRSHNTQTPPMHTFEHAVVQLPPRPTATRRPLVYHWQTAARRPLVYHCQTATRRPLVYYWQTATRRPLVYHWQTATRRPLVYHWQTATRRPLVYHWQTATRRPLVYHWQTATRRPLVYHWQTATRRPLVYHWQTATRRPLVYHWHTATRRPLVYHFYEQGPYLNILRYCTPRNVSVLIVRITLSSRHCNLHSNSCYSTFYLKSLAVPCVSTYCQRVAASSPDIRLCTALLIRECHDRHGDAMKPWHSSVMR